jgi:hypothetical protein
LVAALRVATPLRLPEPPTAKPCTKCRRIKALAELNTDPRRRDGRRSECRLCQRAQSAAIYDARRESAAGLR